jgi:hypothetical protein
MEYRANLTAGFVPVYGAAEVLPKVTTAVG